MDYYADYANYCREQLSSAGFTFNDNDHTKVVEGFLNCLVRQVPAAPRRIIKSDGFRWPLQVRGALNNFCRKSEKGRSLKPFLSTRIRKAHYNDLLFNDWLIHHFHLGNESSQGVIARADYLLFAIVLDDAILCIDILPHSDDEVWYKKEMVDIAYKNWPQIFESTNLKGILPSTTQFTNAEIKDLRRANVGYTLTMADGSVNMGLGMGSMSNGYSMRAQMEHMRIKRTCVHLQEYTAANYEMFIDEAKKLGASIKEPFDFHIQFYNSRWGFYEANSECFFNLEAGLGLAPHRLL